jgi:hypothetical protein
MLGKVLGQSSDRLGKRVIKPDSPSETAEIAPRRSPGSSPASSTPETPLGGVFVFHGSYDLLSGLTEASDSGSKKCSRFVSTAISTWFPVRTPLRGAKAALNHAPA